MRLIVEKYHGLGNDYLVYDPNKNKMELNPANVQLMCNRNFGVGADGVLEAGRQHCGEKRQRGQDICKVPEGRGICAEEGLHHIFQRRRGCNPLPERGRDPAEGIHGQGLFLEQRCAGGRPAQGNHQ